MVLAGHWPVKYFSITTSHFDQALKLERMEKNLLADMKFHL